MSQSPAPLAPAPRVVRRAVTIAPGRVLLEPADVSTALGPNDVGVEVQRVGICGSDLHVYLGRHPYTTYPVVQGHEVAGVVSAIGRDVRGMDVGTSVVLKPQLTCGRCAMCRAGREHICTSLRVMGFQAPGAAQEYIVVDQANLVPVPAGVSLDDAALVEPAAVAVHALGRVESDARRVLVLGAGPVGNIVAQVAAARGADVVIADVAQRKLEVARRRGLRTVEVADDDMDVLGEAFAEGPDVVVECVGRESTMAAAIRLAPRGASVIVVGVFGDPVRVDMGLVQDRELRVHGSLMYRLDDYRQAIELISGRKIDVASLITHRYTFDDLPRAYEDVLAHREEVLKAVIEVS